jgi:spoIIIJ-associated protein
MQYEFEGKNEKDAIEKAAEELGLEQDSFDVEILENHSGGLFKHGTVKIRVTVDDGMGPEPVASEAPSAKSGGAPRAATPAKGRRDVGSKLPSGAPAVVNPEFEDKIIDFVGTVLDKMGYEGKIAVQFREDRKIGFQIESPDSAIIIGKKGRNLDALQLLANNYAGKIGETTTPKMDDVRIVLDSEGYRLRREESLVREAYEAADRVKQTHKSILLEPMNPYDRRIVHAALNDIVELSSDSEGEGVYRQIRVAGRGNK